MSEERLQKILAAAGVASRRKAELFITQGRVTVNGKIVTELGTKVDPQRDAIKVDGKRIRARPSKVYLILNKPRGYLTTTSDPQGRPTVFDLLRPLKARVFPVGRLDYDTEGLLLFTNDGDLAQALLHPRYEFPKTYLAKVKGVLTDEEIAKLERGVTIPARKVERTARCKVTKVRKTAQNSWIEVELREGKKRQIRRMLQRVGHPVLKLKRTRLGFLNLLGLARGQWRYLEPQEIARLRRATGVPS